MLDPARPAGAVVRRPLEASAHITTVGATVLRVRIVAPLPPTLNHAYRRGSANRSGGDTYRTDALVTFEHTIWAAVRAAGWSMPPLLPAPLAMWLWFFLSDARRRDLDNLIKPTLDGVSRALGFDDCGIDCLVVHKGIDRANPRCVVRVEPRERVLSGHERAGWAGDESGGD